MDDLRPRNDRIPFLGVVFDHLSLPAAVEAINQRGRSGLLFASVVTPNVDHLVRLDREPELASLYAGAWLVLCDSRIVQPLAKLSGLGLPIAPGADIARELFHRVIQPDDAVAIVGGSAQTVSVLKERFGLKRLAHHVPPMNLRQTPDAIAAAASFVAEQKALFTFLCVGSPQQEMIAEAVRRRGDATGVGLCLGAALEFVTGEKARAPVLMQRLRLEWLHRLASEPKRLWRRYLVDGPSILAIWWRWRRAQKPG